MAVAVVSFDLVGTLVTRDYVDYFWLDLIPRVYAEERGVAADEARKMVYEEYNRVGPCDIRWYIPGYWLRKLSLSTPLEELVKEAAARIRVYEDAAAAVSELRSRYRLVVLTNTPVELAKPALEHPALRGAFSALVSCTSHFALPRKTAEFYRAALRILGVSAGEVVHVGDDPIYDCAVPRSLGIRAYHLDRQGRGDISALTDLLELLR